jgi:hypothetical protein
MDHYDPLNAPDAEGWLALDESERLALVRRFHLRARVRVPNLTVHVGIHAVVENQIALGDETPVARTALRLMAEGLDRHQAIHAIGAAFIGVIHDMTKQAGTNADPTKRYYAELEQLSAERWRQSG